MLQLARKFVKEHGLSQVNKHAQNFKALEFVSSLNKTYLRFPKTEFIFKVIAIRFYDFRPLIWQRMNTVVKEGWGFCFFETSATECMLQWPKEAEIWWCYIRWVGWTQWKFFPIQVLKSVNFETFFLWCPEDRFWFFGRWMIAGFFLNIVFHFFLLFFLLWSCCMTRIYPRRFPFWVIIVNAFFIPANKTTRQLFYRRWARS